MLVIEENAMEIINKLLANQHIPLKKLKTMKLYWRCEGGNYFPFLDCEFYQEENQKKNQNVVLLSPPP